MKKMYIQPEIEITDVKPQSIVCYSGGFDETPNPIVGQAPERRGKPIE